MQLTNNDAQFLIDLQKRLDEIRLKVPDAGKVEKYIAHDSDDAREFVFRFRIANGNRDNRHKATYNLFYKEFQLLRLDTDANGSHFNTDGTIIPPHTPHIHVYDEFEGDNNAYVLSANFSDPTSFIQTLLDFFTYSNIENVAELQIIEQRRLDFDENIHR